MKFGKQLLSSKKDEWSLYYLDYDEAKLMIKQGSLSGKFSETDEDAFVAFLRHELEKVSSFQSARARELIARIDECENVLSKIFKTSDENDPRMKHVTEEMSRITTDITELSKYMRMNYSGFIKILKKHDKYTSYKSKPMFMVHLESKPFYKEDFDSLIIRMSKLYESSRTGNKQQQNLQSAVNASQNFIRRTTKYWVHPENVTEVKCIILKYLPVLVFSSKSEKEPDAAITSIYFDNDSFELYQGRLEKSEGAEALRLRWYGDMSQTEIFVERKTHREDWTGESSVKERFPIKEKYVNDYLNGSFTLEKTITKFRDRKLKSEKELQELDHLSKEIQTTVLEKKLHPMIRTFYNRTAFQLPGDARVRISLDTDLTMIREDNEDVPRSGDNWRRMDVGTKPPFSNIDPEDVNVFPYAVLEVKLQTQHGTKAPPWVEELVNGHLVEEVPKFSKFIHGVATLLDKKVSLLPFWLPQMDKDIRKPPATGYNSFKSSLDNLSPVYTQEKQKQKQEIEIVVDNNTIDYQDEQDENAPLLGNGESSSYVKRTERSSEGAATRFIRKISQIFLPKQPQSNENENGSQKRIVLPVRIEPKVFFANERTFLSWLHFCIVLGGLALGLLNFGDKVGQISGLIFTLVAMMFIIYALFLYQWRAHQIRNRHPGPYDDRVGPTVLVTALFFAILTNFYLKFTAEGIKV